MEGPKTIRISDESKERFNEIAVKEGWNQNQALSRLIDIYEIEQAKLVIGERRTDIEEFQMHVQAICDSYRMSLQLNLNAEERIKESLRVTLESHQKTIQTLQTKVADLESGRDALKNMYKEAMNKQRAAVDESKRLASELEKTETLCSEYSFKNKSLSDMLTEYKGEHEQNKVFQKEIRDWERKNQTLQDEVSMLKSSFELFRTQSEAELKIAILNEKNRLQEQLSATKDAHNNEYKELVEKLELLRRENRQLEKRADELERQNNAYKKELAASQQESSTIVIDPQ